MGPAFLPESLDLLGLAVLVARHPCSGRDRARAGASNEELQKMFAERERLLGHTSPQAGHKNL